MMTIRSERQQRFAALVFASLTLCASCNSAAAADFSEPAAYLKSFLRAEGISTGPARRLVGLAEGLLGASGASATAQSVGRTGRSLQETGASASVHGLFSSRLNSRQPLRLDPAVRSLGATEGTKERFVPGVTVAIYPDFFRNASAVAVQLLKENFRKAQLKSLTTVAHVPVLGDFKLKLENVRLEGLDLDRSDTGVSLGRDGRMVLAVHGLDATVTGHLRWRRTQFPFISGGCQAQVTAENGHVVLRAEVVNDGEGRPSVVSLQAAALDFDSIAIRTSEAKLAWLYNAVAEFARTQIQDAITREVAAQVTTTVPAVLDGLLLGVPTTVEVKGLQLNVSLASDPAVSKDRLVVRDWGRFQNPDGRLQDCPFTRASPAVAREETILPTGAPYMLVANLDESIANCLTWDLFKQGRLQHSFVGDDLPEKVLFTETWRLVIPALYNRCPDCMLALDASVTAPPVTYFDATRGITSSGIAHLSFSLANDGHSSRKLQGSQGSASDGSLTHGPHLFTLALSGETTVPDLRLVHDSPSDPYKLMLSMQVNKSSLAVEVVDTEIGDINKAALHVALTIGAFLVEDQVNHGILEDGFPLPEIPHVAVTRANVSVGDAVLALGSDLAYAG